MNFEDVRRIEEEIVQIQKTYELFREETRLNRSKAARVEFLTTVRYIDRYLEPGAKIMDVGAGAGEYSLYLAKKGYRVCALELAESNIQAFRSKLTPELPVELVQEQINAMDDENYAQYLRYHEYICEKPEMLGMSNHLLFVGEA